MKVKSESEVTEMCPTLSDPMDCSLPGSSVHGIFQARVLYIDKIILNMKGKDVLVTLVGDGERVRKEEIEIAPGII